MRITIIGWYGTETIGDRAILAGLYNLWSKSIGSFEIRIGCLDTLLSERMLDEDYNFFKDCAFNDELKISLFDSRIKSELDCSIQWADIIAIGGGPLMELEPMYMLLYAFKKAKKYKKKTIIAGCGMGPFLTPTFKNIALELVDNADVIVFRDAQSQEFYHKGSCKRQRTYSAIDPAIFAADFYLSKHSDSFKEKNVIAANFREPTIEYAGIRNNYIDFMVEFVKRLACIPNMDIRLVPMHTFYVGGDDRYVLNKIRRYIGQDNIYVENRPLSLEQTMETYRGALFCIGMRFHSVLLQTMLNGKNFIIDYTDPQKGKTINLLRQLQLVDEYKDKYFSLVKDLGTLQFNYQQMKRVVVDKALLKRYESIYIDVFKNVLA